MSTIEKNIELILKDRESKQTNIKGLLDKLSELNDSFIRLSEMVNIPIHQPQKTITDLKTNLQKVKNRFTRDTINIVVIGRARQGKSRLLQAITGLDKTCIPDGDSLDCTAVKSQILNTANQKGAKVSFFNRKEFLEKIIQPYYKSLNLDIPRTIDDFKKDTQVSSIEGTLGGKDKELIKHITKYKNELHRYEDLIGKDSLQINHSEIRTYVAQDDEFGNRDANFNYMVVKHVDIYAEFPQKNVGKVTVIDLPGIGDTKLGLLENISNEIQTNVDIVYFVKYPKDKGDNIGSDYIDLYDQVKDAIKPVPLDKCSYLILNNDENNKKMCNTLLQSISDSGMNVTDTKIINVTKESEVEELILSSLEGLTKNLKEIDYNLLKGIEEKKKKLKNIIDDSLSNIQLTSIDEELINDEFDGWFKNWIKFLQEKLKNHKKELENRVKNEDAKYDKIFTQEIQNIRQQAEDKKDRYKEEITKEISRADKQLLRNIIEEQVNMLRTKLAKEFFGLDNKLEEMMNGMKQELVDIFSSNELRLNKVFDENEDPKKSIESLAQKFNDKVKNNSISASLNNFSQFKLLYRGIMYNDVREELTKRLGATSYSVDDMINWSPEDVAIKLVDELYADALVGAVKVLHGFNTQPDRTVNAITEELVDGIAIHADTEDEWRKLLRRYKKKVWSTDFKQVEKMTENGNKISMEIENTNKLFENIKNIQLTGDK